MLRRCAERPHDPPHDPSLLLHKVSLRLNMAPPVLVYMTRLSQALTYVLRLKSLRTDIGDFKPRHTAMAPVLADKE